VDGHAHGGLRNRFNELEALRGIAAIAIVVFHAYQFSGGPNGYVWDGRIGERIVLQLEAAVAWFFVLSAFLLYLPIARAALAGAAQRSPREFLARRAIRILPLYFVATLIVWAVRNPSLPGDWRDLLEHLTFTQIYDSRRIFYTIGPAWSLAVEVHFYVFVTLISAGLGGLARSAGRRVTTTVVLGLPIALIGASIAFRVLAVTTRGVPHDRWSVWFSFPARADAFGIGMLVAGVLALRDSHDLAFAGRVLLRAVAVVAIVVAFSFTIGSDSWRLWFHTAYAASAALLISSSVFGPAGTLWERVLATRGLAYLGLLSYSIYLWHEPILVELSKWHWLFGDPREFVLNAVVLVALSVAVGFVSYWVLEYPTGHLRFLLDDRGDVREQSPREVLHELTTP
jgi:peptidoglycan/LPS O-acetylase OafA/YrhL